MLNQQNLKKVNDTFLDNILADIVNQNFERSFKIPKRKELSNVSYIPPYTVDKNASTANYQITYSYNTHWVFINTKNVTAYGPGGACDRYIGAGVGCIVVDDTLGKLNYGIANSGAASFGTNSWTNKYGKWRTIHVDNNLDDTAGVEGISQPNHPRWACQPSSYAKVTKTCTGDISLTPNKKYVGCCTQPKNLLSNNSARRENTVFLLKQIKNRVHKILYKIIVKEVEEEIEVETEEGTKEFIKNTYEKNVEVESEEIDNYDNSKLYFKAEKLKQDCNWINTHFIAELNSEFLDFTQENLEENKIIFKNILQQIEEMSLDTEVIKFEEEQKDYFSVHYVAKTINEKTVSIDIEIFDGEEFIFSGQSIATIAFLNTQCSKSTENIPVSKTGFSTGYVNGNYVSTDINNGAFRNALKACLPCSSCQIGKSSNINCSKLTFTTILKDANYNEKYEDILWNLIQKGATATSSKICKNT